MLSKSKKIIKRGALSVAMAMSLAISGGVFADAYLKVFVINESDKQLNIKLESELGGEASNQKCEFTVGPGEPRVNICKFSDPTEGYRMQPGKYYWYQGHIFISHPRVEGRSEFFWRLNGLDTQCEKYQWEKTTVGENKLGTAIDEKPNRTGKCFMDDDGSCDNTITLTIPKK